MWIQSFNNLAYIYIYTHFLFIKHLHVLDTHSCRFPTLHVPVTETINIDSFLELAASIWGHRVTHLLYLIGHSVATVAVKWVQSLSIVWFFAIPWTAACQASLSITNSWSLLKLMSIKLVMPNRRKIILNSEPPKSHTLWMKPLELSRVLKNRPLDLVLI